MVHPIYNALRDMLQEWSKQILHVHVRITGYLCDPEICAFWQQMAICGFYFMRMRGSTWGMAIFIVDIHYANYICAISVLFT